MSQKSIRCCRTCSKCCCLSCARNLKRSDDAHSKMRDQVCACVCVCVCTNMYYGDVRCICLKGKLLYGLYEKQKMFIKITAILLVPNVFLYVAKEYKYFHSLYCCIIGSVNTHFTSYHP